MRYDHRSAFPTVCTFSPTHIRNSVPLPLSSILLHLETYSRLNEHPQFSIVMQAETVQDDMKDLTRKLVELNPYVTPTVTKTVSSPLPNVPLGIATHQQRGKW